MKYAHVILKLLHSRGFSACNFFFMKIFANFLKALEQDLLRGFDTHIGFYVKEVRIL
jgi:hypothetical protein